MKIYIWLVDYLTIKNTELFVRTASSRNEERQKEYVITIRIRWITSKCIANKITSATYYDKRSNRSYDPTVT
jgi:hypothetical protein